MATETLVQMIMSEARAAAVLEQQPIASVPHVAIKSLRRELYASVDSYSYRMRSQLSSKHAFTGARPTCSGERPMSTAEVEAGTSGTDSIVAGVLRGTTRMMRLEDRPAAHARTSRVRDVPRGLDARRSLLGCHGWDHAETRENPSATQAGEAAIWISSVGVVRCTPSPLGCDHPDGQNADRDRVANTPPASPRGGKSVDPLLGARRVLAAHREVADRRVDAADRDRRRNAATRTPAGECLDLQIDLLLPSPFLRAYYARSRAADRSERVRAPHGLGQRGAPEMDWRHTHSAAVTHRTRLDVGQEDRAGTVTEEAGGLLRPDTTGPSSTRADAVPQMVGCSSSWLGGRRKDD